MANYTGTGRQSGAGCAVPDNVPPGFCTQVVVQVVEVVLGLYLSCREMPRESGCRRVLVSRALMVDLLLRLEVLIRCFNNKCRLVTWIL